MYKAWFFVLMPILAKILQPFTLATANSYCEMRILKTYMHDCISTVAIYITVIVVKPSFLDTLASHNHDG